LGSTHIPPHFVDPPTQSSEQDPAEQTWPEGQALPQAPQLATSFWVFTQELPHWVLPP
jgi:hypothetical protein